MNYPESNTPLETLIAISGEISEGVIFHPHPKTPKEKLIKMLGKIGRGVIFKPHPDTPKEILVAMIKSINSGVFVINSTGDKVKISESMPDQERLNIAGEGHREETEEQGVPGEQSLFRGEHRVPITRPRHR